MPAPHNLTEFLLARIAEDEAVARAAQHQEQPTWRADFHSRDAMGRKFSVLGSSGQFRSSDAVDHVVRFQPSRVIAECEAKRRIVESFEIAVHDSDAANIYPEPSNAYAQKVTDFGYRVIWELSQPYLPHSEFRSEWTPRISGD